MNDETQLFSTVELLFDAASGELSATLAPSIRAEQLSLPKLQVQIKEAGYGDYFVEEKTLSAVITAANKGASETFIVGERRDAMVDVKVSDDSFFAHIDTAPAFGGEALTLELIERELQQQGVASQCFQLDALKEALSGADQNLRNICVAEALQAVRGEDTVFEPLVSSVEEVRPDADAEGSVDMHELQEFVVVEPGTALMRRIPPTSGVAGIDVKGRSIAPEPGSDIPFAKESQGIEPDKDNADVLLAAIKGHPVFLKTGVQVDPTLRMKGVNVASGNVDFDGSVDIKGDVASGFEVKASGDINVNGIVDKAKLMAGGSITITGGLIGEERQEGDASETKVYLEAANDISVKFVSYAEMKAGGNISVREYMVHSHVTAGDKILLGQDGGKGFVIGGYCHADKAIIANVLGSDAYLSTAVRAGCRDRLRSELQAAMEEQKVRTRERVQLEQILSKVKSKGKLETLGEAMLAKLRKMDMAIKGLGAKLNELEKTIPYLEGQLEQSADASIEAKRKIFPNVKLTIDGAIEAFEQESGPKVLVREGSMLIAPESTKKNKKKAKK